MSTLIDDISRVIASSVSRRQAFKMVSGAMGSALLASLGLGRATPALATDGRGDNGDHGDKGDRGDPRCRRRWVRCQDKCYPPGSTCCGSTVCNEFHQCCTDHCCRHFQSCCGSKCCHFGSKCCNNDTCCPFGVACCNGKCCPQPRAICCGGACCPEGYLCCNGSCVRRRPSPSSVCVRV